ncbi:hypothetical protein D3C73_1043780 [compost metagenome]
MQIDHVADDVGLGFQVGEDVDGRVRDEQRACIRGHFHDEHMADAPAAAQTGGARDDFVHQFVGMQAALHQQRGLAVAHQRHGGFGGGVAMRHVDNARIAQVQIELGGRVADLLFRPHQNGMQEAQVAGFQRGGQGRFVAGVGDGAEGRFQRLRAGDQGVVMRGRGQCHARLALAD